MTKEQAFDRILEIMKEKIITYEDIKDKYTKIQKIILEYLTSQTHGKGKQ